jgi:phosphoserine phosphatase
MYPIRLKASRKSCFGLSLSVLLIYRSPGSREGCCGKYEVGSPDKLFTMPTSNTSAISPTATAFVESVLRLEPKLAAFDCDGTLWSGDAGEGFFRWELNRGVISEDTKRWVMDRYVDYQAGKVSEDDMCAEMATINAGLSETEVRQASREYFDESIAAHIFPEMQLLVRRLKEQGCEIWAVSSTSEWVIREAMAYFDIPAAKILAVAVEIENGRLTDKLIRIPSGPGKATAIREVVRRTPDASFGNSRWDTEMLALARHPFAVNPNPDLEKVAKERGWTLYFPDSVRR